MTAGSEAEARFAALLTPAGQELLGYLADQAITPDSMLRLGTQLRARYPASLVAAALAQHELRLAARPKFTRAMDMYFTRPGLEQASGELIAGYRAARYAGAERVADLCCGIGGDLLALAPTHHVRAVDADPLHLRMAQANVQATQAGGDVCLVQQDVRDVDLDGLDAVFIDPARRTGSRRLRPGDSEPPLDWCFSLAGPVRRVAIKAAPGLPRDAVPPGWETEFIALRRDLKEAVAWSPALATAPRRATILSGGDPRTAHTRTAHTLTMQPGTPPAPVAAPGEYLLDPNPAVTRAGLVAELAQATGGWQIDPQIAFLATDAPVRTPFARTLRVIDSAPWQQKELPARLRRLDIGAVDIRRRGLAGDVDALRRQLKLSGTRRATLAMTRLQDRPWALVCVDLPD